MVLGMIFQHTPLPASAVTAPPMPQATPSMFEARARAGTKCVADLGHRGACLMLGEAQAYEHDEDVRHELVVRELEYIPVPAV